MATARTAQPPQQAMSDEPAIDPMMAGAGGAPTDTPAEEAAEGEGDGGYDLVIHVGPEGDLTAGKGGGDMQPASSIKEAMTILLGIFRADGKDSAEEQFEDGFAQSRGAPQGGMQ